MFAKNQQILIYGFPVVYFIFLFIKNTNAGGCEVFSFSLYSYSWFQVHI